MSSELPANLRKALLEMRAHMIEKIVAIDELVGRPDPAFGRPPKLNSEVLRVMSFTTPMLPVEIAKEISDSSGFATYGYKTGLNTRVSASLGEHEKAGKVRRLGAGWILIGADDEAQGG